MKIKYMSWQFLGNVASPSLMLLLQDDNMMFNYIEYEKMLDIMNKTIYANEMMAKCFQFLNCFHLNRAKARCHGKRM